MRPFIRRRRGLGHARRVAPEAPPPRGKGRTGRSRAGDRVPGGSGRRAPATTGGPRLRYPRWRQRWRTPAAARGARIREEDVHEEGVPSGWSARRRPASAYSVSVRRLAPDTARMTSCSVDLRDVQGARAGRDDPRRLPLSRGMLEFWIDPESPYYKDVFGSGKEFVSTATPGWRSALAADTRAADGPPARHRRWTAASPPGRPPGYPSRSAPTEARPDAGDRAPRRTPGRTCRQRAPRRASQYSGFRQTIRAALLSHDGVR